MDLKTLEFIIETEALHAKWLNTLSYLENCGARLIAACEHPTEVKEEMLKHAAEEFRHAHYLKSQIPKLNKNKLLDYTLKNMLGGVQSLNYLKTLNIKTSRYLKETIGLKKMEVRSYAYLLVTYAIEVRAEKLYFDYHEILRKTNSVVHVKSIILEEKEHLNEMKEALAKTPSGSLHAQHVLKIENVLYGKWKCAIWDEINACVNEVNV
jgi:hypothetical protein